MAFKPGHREETVMLAQYIKDKGFQDGRQEDRKEGRRESRRTGKYDLLERILTRRFGPLPDWAKQRLLSASYDIVVDTYRPYT
jgi:hypothetical protein